MCLVLLLAAGSSGYGLLLLETLAALVVIALVAWVAVRLGRGRLGGGRGARRMRIAERLPLEPRRSLYLVEVDGESLLVGSSDGGVRLVKELERAEVDPAPPPEDR
jgi:flagellar protein FliO/FliZ